MVYPIHRDFGRVGKTLRVLDLWQFEGNSSYCDDTLDVLVGDGDDAVAISKLVQLRLAT